MSWDLMIVKNADSEQPLGSLAEVRNKIRQYWELESDSDESRFESPMIQTNPQGDAIVISFSIRDGSLLSELKGFCDANQWTAIDCQEGEEIDWEQALKSFGNWQDFRDDIVGNEDY